MREKPSYDQNTKMDIIIWFVRVSFRRVVLSNYNQVAPQRRARIIQSLNCEAGYICFSQTLNKNTEETKNNTDPVSGQEISTDVTTTLVTDGQVQETHMDAPSFYDGIPRTLTGCEDFLGKPIIIAAGLWASTDVANATLAGSAITKSIFPQAWLDKLIGFRFMRATIKFRLVLNCNPFQSGKLILTCIPAVQDARYIATQHMRAGSTQLPNVEIDCRDSEAILEWPYISQYNFYNILEVNDPPSDWGSYRLSVLSPLTTGSGGSLNCDWTLYMSMHNVELAVPICPQGKGPRKTKRAPSKTIGTEDTHKVSDGLRILGNVAKAAEEIPLLSSIAGPAAWVFRTGANLASSLGWSKATMGTNPTPIQRSFARYMCNSDGSDANPVLALNHDAAITTTTQFSITDEDEHSFRFLLSRSSFIAEATWLTTDAVNTSILSLDISPSTLYEQKVVTSATGSSFITQGPPINYLSQFFKFWRGGVEVMIKMVKTDYHTGRLQISYTPSNSATVTAPNVSTTGVFAIREIVDIRTGSEICLTLPYMNSTNWTSTSQYLGQLDIRVVNVLRVPETAAPQIVLLVYVRAAPDFEYSAPMIPGYGVYKPPYLTQGRDLECAAIGDTNVSSLTTNFSELSMGESVTSVKQFINRYGLVNVTPLPTLSNAETVQFWPWMPGFTYLYQDDLAKQTQCDGDAYSFLAHFYGYYRGGARVIMRTTPLETTTAGKHNAVTASNITWQLASYTDKNVFQSGNINFGGGGAQTTLFTKIPGMTSFSVQDGGPQVVGAVVPYYCPTHMSRFEYFRVGSDDAGLLPIVDCQPQNVVNFTSFQGFTNYALYRSFPDDFQLIFFLGSPPVLLAQFAP